jgi:hypothetical protein
LQRSFLAISLDSSLFHMLFNIVDDPKLIRITITY